ncbi:MAG: rhamnulokinase [Dysgonamonadaceae bacterium]|jgi:rhamnulokinase|nr:rhamnulokinase [Dysgonamonadaceae bacterium]
MDKKYFLAFDLGATSGRSILASIENGKIEMKELTRFPSRIIHLHGKYYWSIYALYGALKEGLRAAARENVKIESVGIDTWGVDFVYLGEDGTFMGLPRTYRDPYTNGIPEEVFGIVPKKEIYGLTGIQIMNFNSLYQLFAAKKEHSSAYHAASEALFMPDALAYLLSGEKVCEYTIASTSQILNPRTKCMETGLLENLGLKKDLFRDIVMPGTVIGTLTKDIEEDTGLKNVKVVAVAGHDTASAIAAIPAENERFAYLSSGTWSLMGIEVPEPVITEETYQMNFTNEGGVEGTTRFLKNITGMWLLEQCRAEWAGRGKEYTYSEITKMAESAEPFRSLVDSDHPSFANPGNMPEAIKNYCKNTNQPVPGSESDFIRCIFESLALKYKSVLESLNKISLFPIEKLHVIGGGSQNKLLNQWIANSIGIPVVAGPAEATAMGNIMMQAKALGLVGNLSDIRNLVRNSVAPELFLPQDAPVWEDAYRKFVDKTAVPKL